MWTENGKSRNMQGMGLLLCAFGGYLAGCLGMNLYWKYTTGAAAAAFYISVYAGNSHAADGNIVFWHILRRDLGILSVVYFAGLLGCGRMVVGTILAVMGGLLGILTSGILLTEGVYWWLMSFLWMLPCFFCSGILIGREMYGVWQGKYVMNVMTGQRGNWKKRLLLSGGHILWIFGAAVILCWAESRLLCVFLIKT